jgi:hypothetical protein
LRKATFTYGGHRHELVGRQRRYGQAGFMIQRIHDGEQCGHSYWVAATSLPQEVRDELDTADARRR